MRSLARAAAMLPALGLIACATGLAVQEDAKTAGKIDSGLAVGASTPAYHPQHVWGPDKGTNTCPV